MDGPETDSSTKLQPNEMPSVKGLDSSEPAIRRATLKTIMDNLQSRHSSSPFSSTECLQLWRGFFVAIYMHDSRNALSVQNLLREIAGTFSIMASKDDALEKDKTQASEPPASWLEPYHTTFWETITREWATIDSHRMNKYLLLVRFVLRELFKVCLQSNFKPAPNATTNASKSKSKKTKKAKDEEAHDSGRSLKDTEACVKILETVGPLNPSQRKISDGLRLHMLDIWSDELFGALDNLKETHKSGEDGEVDTKSAVGVTPVLLLLRDSLEKVSKSDSGAQRHIRLRAKDAIQSVNEQMEERSLATSA